MSYVIVSRARAWWPVEFKGVSEDGEIVTNRVELKFLIHDEDEVRAIAAEAAAIPTKVNDAGLAALTSVLGEPPAEPGAEGASGAATEERKSVREIYADFIERIACDWRGVAAENGVALAFERAAIEAMCGVPNFFRAACDAYVAVREAREEIREGN